MDKVVRAFPITSHQDLLNFAQAAGEFSAQQKQPFFENFGDAIEDWFYQEFNGQPSVICVAQGPNLEQGFANYAKLDDEFSLWFKDQVATLTGVNVDESPKGPVSSHVFHFCAL